MPDRAKVVGNLFRSAGATYDEGDAVVLSIQWSDPSSTSAPLDPDTGYTIATPSGCSLVVRKPDGSEMVPPPVVTLTGTVFSASLAPPLEPGQYWYGFTASGTFVGYEEASFVVRRKRA